MTGRFVSFRRVSPICERYRHKFQGCRRCRGPGSCHLTQPEAVWRVWFMLVAYKESYALGRKRQFCDFVLQTLEVLRFLKPSSDIVVS